MNAENNAIQSKLAQLLGQLREFQSKTTHAYWRVYFVSACYGFVAAMQGIKFLIVYLGVLVVIFMIHGIIERRHQQQMNLIVELIEELQKQKQI
jgi:hypothetical protein